jgi:tyrosinase
VNWLTSSITVNGKVIPTNVHAKYVTCLDAPNYTVFSNTTSAQQWNGNADTPVVPLESPHNDIHLSVGGFDVPGQGDDSPITDANGDMGENNTAGFDPIFFFHHCFVDRVFWLWQQRHGATDTLEIIPHYPGTNSVDGQGPTPGIPGNAWLDLDSPLDPFTRDEGGTRRPFTSRDCVNIETQLGYTYGPGSLEDVEAARAALDLAAPAAEEAPAPVVHVKGINRAAIRGSFLVSAFATIDGKRQHIGTEAVLSRWNVTGCANCQAHLQSRAAFSLQPLVAAGVMPDDVQVEVRTHDGLLGGRARSLVPAATPAVAASAQAGSAAVPFRVEIREAPREASRAGWSPIPA